MSTRVVFLLMIVFAMSDGDVLAQASPPQAPAMDQQWPDAYRSHSAGVVLPRVVREQKPRYTADAKRALIQGAVLVECVVETNGRVRRARTGDCAHRAHVHAPRPDRGLGGAALGERQSSKRVGRGAWPPEQSLYRAALERLVRRHDAAKADDDHRPGASHSRGSGGGCGFWVWFDMGQNSLVALLERDRRAADEAGFFRPAS